MLTLLFRPAAPPFPLAGDFHMLSRILAFRLISQPLNVVSVIWYHPSLKFVHDEIYAMPGEAWHPQL